jgi:uncharacterized repeat protein (TIGR01451 family)
MDYTITPAKPRSIVRRLAPWAAALGLFAGGGYAVYYHAAPMASGANATAATASETATAAGTSTSLLAALPAGGARPDAEPRYTTPFDHPVSRYASAPSAVPPALPPAPQDDEVMTPRSAEAVESPVNPFAAAAAGAMVGRYAPGLPGEDDAEPVTATPASAAMVSTSVIEAAAAEDATTTEPPAADEPPAATVADVARGQEPSANPLRSGSRPSATALPVGFETEAEDSDDASEPSLPATSAGAAPTSGDLTTPAAAGFVTMAGEEEKPVAAVSRDPYLAAEPAAANPADSASPLPNAMTAPLRATAPAVVDSVPSYATAPPAGASAQFATSAPAPTIAAVPTPYDNPLVGAANPTPTPGFETVAGAGRPGELTLEGVQSPGLALQKLAPVEIQVGKPCMFQVRVQNASQRPIHNVQVIDEVPLGTQLIGTAPKAMVAAGKLTWDLGTLSPGEERIVEMELMPTDEGEIGSVATVSFASQASVKTRSTRPQLDLRLSSAPRVMIGEAHTVQIEVSNPGTGDATGVMLLANIPEGVTHEAGPALEFEIGTLRAGETKRLDLVLNAAAAGLIDNIMSARADANLQVQANCQFEVIAPELNLTIDGPSKRILERPATFTMSVDNPGTASARDVQLVTQLPPGLKFVSANNHGEYDAATHSVFWSLPELPANEHGVVELTALAVEAGDHTLQVATRAQQGLEDRAETKLSVEGIVALAFEVQDVQDAIEVGGETAYEIRVVNQGTKTATNVQVVATMPAGLRAQMVQGEARYAIEGDRVVFAPLPQLAPKSEAAFRFGVQGLGAGDQRVTLQLTTDEVREPIVEVESTQVYADE